MGAPTSSFTITQPLLSLLLRCLILNRACDDTGDENGSGHANNYRQYGNR